MGKLPIGFFLAKKWLLLDSNYIIWYNGIRVIQLLETALKLLNMIEEAGFKAYIVGGFVRDYLLGIESLDVDICTDARPKDIRDIFQDACLPREEYGSVTVNVKNIRFEITTFRKEYTYYQHRKPLEFEYINDLREDLRRRDFLINTLCMDKDGVVLDLYHGKKDLEEKIIHTVGDSFLKFSEDAFRILRAVRIATVLNFQLSEDVKSAILRTKHLLKDISYERKKEELDKIFSSVYADYGIHLLLDLGLDQELELPKLKDVVLLDDLVGVWAQLDVVGLYPFTNNEKSLIKNIQTVLKLNNLNHRVLYQYGLYVNSLAATIKGISKKEVSYQYSTLPIKSRSEIAVDGLEIAQVLDRKPGKYIREIIDDLENKIIDLDLPNDHQVLLDYIAENYRSTQ